MPTRGVDAVQRREIFFAPVFLHSVQRTRTHLLFYHKKRQIVFISSPMSPLRPSGSSSLELLGEGNPFDSDVDGVRASLLARTWTSTRSATKRGAKFIRANPLVVLVPLLLLAVCVTAGVFGVVTISNAIAQQRQDDATNEAQGKRMLRDPPLGPPMLLLDYSAIIPTCCWFSIHACMYVYTPFCTTSFSHASINQAALTPLSRRSTSSHCLCRASAATSWAGWHPRGSGLRTTPGR